MRDDGTHLLDVTARILAERRRARRLAPPRVGRSGVGRHSHGTVSPLRTGRRDLIVHGTTDLLGGPSDTLGNLLGGLATPCEAPKRRALGFRRKSLELQLGKPGHRSSFAMSREWIGREK
jgi:hypothetical protein